MIDDKRILDYAKPNRLRRDFPQWIWALVFFIFLVLIVGTAIFALNSDH